MVQALMIEPQKNGDLFATKNGTLEEPKRNESKNLILHEKPILQPVNLSLIKMGTTPSHASALNILQGLSKSLVDEESLHMFLNKVFFLIQFFKSLTIYPTNQSFCNNVFSCCSRA